MTFWWQAHEHSFIVSEGQVICQTCGTRPGVVETKTVTTTNGLTHPARTSE